MSDATTNRPFLRQFATLFLMGMAGVLSLPLILAGQLDKLRAAPGMPHLPSPALIALALVQPTFLLAAAVAVGVALAWRLGLRSHVAERARGETTDLALRAEVPLATVAGVLVAVAIVVLDLAFRSTLGDVDLGPEQMAPRLPMLIAGLLYGGISEELIMRWGLLTLFAWIGWKLLQRSDAAPRPWIMWSAILLTALLFGVGHLPALRMLVPLTPMLVVRTVLLNTIAGVLFGWLYWRRSLEAAMVAHASGHVVFFAVSLFRLGGINAA